MTNGLHTLLIGIQLVAGLALFYSCFCRLTKTNRDTVREIRWAIWLEGVAAALVAFAPFLPGMVPELAGKGHFKWAYGTTPTWVFVALLVAAALVQMSTSRFWRFKVPEDFQMRGFVPWI